MGYIQCYGRCVACGILMAFNPDRVPSIRVRQAPDGTYVLDPAGFREPVCRCCFEVFNRKRKAAGLEPVELLPGAYEPAPEEEVST